MKHSISSFGLPSAKRFAGLVCTLLLSLVMARAECSSLLLYNGKITTMDSARPTANWILLQGDRIEAVGTGTLPSLQPCTRRLDLRGRRVIPGLIDSHNHIVVVSLRPGYDIRLDLERSIPETQEALRARAPAAPVGAWLTAIGGWSPEQFSEHRMPTLVELDAASPDRPVFLQTGFDGPSATNTTGKAFFQSHGVKVESDGGIAMGAPTVAAFDALKALQTPQDKQRGTLDVMQYAASLGLTMSDDKGGPWPVGMAHTQSLADTGDRTNVLNPFTDYNTLLELDRAGRMSMRLRIFFYMQDLKPELTFLRARLENQFPDFGDSWLKVSGIGERIYSGPFPATPGSSPDLYLAAARLIARDGWAHDEHGGGLADEKLLTDAWEKVNAETPLAPLRWCLAHVPGIDRETLLRLKAMGVGVSAAGSRYTPSNPPRNGPKDIPPFRLLVESGVQVGYGSDGGTVSALNPWVHMAYMVTGKNGAGQQVAPGQTLTRMQALELYTVRQPWFTHDESSLGSLTPGKLADLAVLSDDFLNRDSVPDDAIRTIHSVFTMVGGKIVFDGGELTSAPASAAHRPRK